MHIAMCSRVSTSCVPQLWDWLCLGGETGVTGPWKSLGLGFLSRAWPSQLAAPMGAHSGMLWHHSSCQSTCEVRC